MSTDLFTQLKTLRLYGMAEAWAEIQAETTDRQARSLRYQLNVAKFPIHRDWVDFDWTETPLSQTTIEQLAQAGFMADAHNLILVGGTGTGKTHLATALGISAIHQGKRVRFFNAVDLVNRLEQEKQHDKTGTLARRLVQVDAVILDELGYLPFPESGGALLFYLISQLYERTSLIITTPICQASCRFFFSPIGEIFFEEKRNDEIKLYGSLQRTSRRKSIATRSTNHTNYCR